jgi:opacity protein-like surface antigen
MRRWFVALCLIGLTSTARAGEFELPTLRGTSEFVPASPRYFRWSGFYAGGQFGTTSASVDFGDAAKTLIETILRHTQLEEEFHPSEWSQLPNGGDRSNTMGGFVGFNTQWQDVILGIEANYNRLTLESSATDSISRIVTMSDFNYAVTVTSGATYQLTDYGSLRVRAGWVMGQFLPFAAVGVAAARGSYSRFASVSYPAPTYALAPPIPPESPPPTPPGFGPVSESQSRNNTIIWGYSLGGGLDFAIMPNMFVRAEYEFVALPIAGMQMNLQNVRVGGGLKF